MNIVIKIMNFHYFNNSGVPPPNKSEGDNSGVPPPKQSEGDNSGVSLPKLNVSDNARSFILLIFLSKFVIIKVLFLTLIYLNIKKCVI